MDAPCGLEGESWIVVGSVGESAAVLRSDDGVAWRQESLPGADPTDGIDYVSAHQVVVGRWATLVLGEDSPPCDDDPDWCGHWQAAWSWTAATGWQRLTRDVHLVRGAHGVRVWAAGDAGFVTDDLDGLMTSPDGWSWTPVATTTRPSALIEDLVVDGDRVVAAGSPLDGETLDAWFGLGTISR